MGLINKNLQVFSTFYIWVKTQQVCSCYFPVGHILLENINWYFVAIIISFGAAVNGVLR
jgi:hypothetical protein